MFSINTFLSQIIYKLNVFCFYHRVVTSIQEPFQTYIEDGCSSIECFKGLYADVFHELKQILNFTFTIDWVKAYGARLDNHSWTGMIG